MQQNISAPEGCDRRVMPENISASEGCDSLVVQENINVVGFEESCATVRFPRCVGYADLTVVGVHRSGAEGCGSSMTAPEDIG